MLLLETDGKAQLSAKKQRLIGIHIFLKNKKEIVPMNTRTICFVVLCAAACSWVAPPAFAQTPPAVTWVHTPGGLVRSDCVHVVPKGARIDVGAGNVYANNALVAHYDDCPEPPADSTTPTSALDGGIVPTEGGIIPGTVGPKNYDWIEDGNDKVDLPSGYNVTTMYGYWLVPGAPTDNGGQTIFLFIGIEDSSENAILQPVLQWGPSAAGGGAYWAIASWGIFPGATYVSPLENNVHVGDELFGGVSADQSGDTLEWTIQIYDEYTGAYSEQGVDTTGYQWVTAYGGVLEGYNLNGSCQEFPSSSTEFYNLAQGNTDSQEQNFVGQGSGYNGCDGAFSVNAGATTVTLNY